MDDTVSGLLVPDGDDAIEFGKRKGIQQECIDGAEDGSVSADTEGERDDGDDGEARPSQEISYCVPGVAYKTLHARLLSLPIANFSIAMSPTGRGSLNRQSAIGNRQSL